MHSSTKPSEQIISLKTDHTSLKQMVRGLVLVAFLASAFAINACDTGAREDGGDQEVTVDDKKPATKVKEKKSPKKTAKKLKPAPDFELETVAGKKVTLSSYKGKVLVIDFWATYCGPCKEAMLHLEKLHKKYKGMGLVVVGVSLDADKEEAAIFTKSLGITYTIGMSNAGILKEYGGLNFIPQTFLIDRSGNISSHYRGYGPLVARAIDKDLEDLLPQ